MPVFSGRGPRTPMRIILFGCCAPAASGHAMAAPPSSVMNSRRLKSNMRPPPKQFDASRAPRRVPRLLRRDVGDPHDLTPLLGFSGDEGSELLGIERHRH